MNRKDFVTKEIDQREHHFCYISDYIWDNPELGFKEEKASRILVQALKTEEFQVTEGVSNMKTAFVASYGDKRPIIGILGEYDALSNLGQDYGVTYQSNLSGKKAGHGCGHHLLGTGSFAAAVAVKEYIKKNNVAGTIKYYGCPAEEGGSGKAFMVRDGIFDDIDCAITWHPGTENGVISGSSLANIEIEYSFKGKSAHAASNPHVGRSALDALELMNVGANFLREHMIQEARIHYSIIDAGGVSPNVVQSFTKALYLVRAPKISQVEKLCRRVDKLAEGAAIMTENKVEKRFVKACMEVLPNDVLGKLLDEKMREIPIPIFSEAESGEFDRLKESFIDGNDLVDRGVAHLTEEERRKIVKLRKSGVSDYIVPYHFTEHSMAGSTDVGDVSQVCPTVQIRAATWIAGTPNHSWQIVCQGKGTIAHKYMLYAGKVMTAAAIELIENSDLLKRAKEEFLTRRNGTRFESVIPKEIMPTNN